VKDIILRCFERVLQNIVNSEVELWFMTSLKLEHGRNHSRD
jgi:hypothetical protein